MRMIHDIAPYRYNNNYGDKRPPQLEDAALYYENSRVLLKSVEDGLRIPSFSDLSPQALAEGEYIFEIDGRGYFLLDTHPQGENLGLHTIRICREELPGCTAFAALTGWQFYRFRDEHKFCSRCGTPVEHHPVDRAYLCPKCGLIRYPRFSPAILALVTDGDRCLMVRSKEYRENMSPIAGFVEVGETFEETVKREVLEEAGIHVKNVRYVASQPWSFGDTIMIAFTAQLDGDDRITCQESEILEAGWYRREDMPPNHSQDSLGGQLLRWFKEGRL